MDASSSLRRPPTVRRATRDRLCPGGRRPPGPDYVGRGGDGDDVWVGQTDGSVAVSVQTSVSKSLWLVKQ